jgi:threonylcarbamoyladenosine tRNA methylthiotransferase MtaB
MNRRYTPEDYIKTVEKILTRLPHAAIGTDVMVGFPGETEEEFAETKKLIEEIPFAYLHVFPFSKRKGTKAALLKDSVPPEVKKERVKILREIGREKSIEYRSSFLNKTLDALVLSETENNHSVALTDNYIRVVLDRKLPPSTPIKVKLTEVGEKREENYGIVIV